MEILYSLVYYVYFVYQMMLIVYVFMSWFPHMRETPLGLLIGRFVEPFLAPIRRVVPTLGFIDISPMIGLFILWFAYRGVIQLLNWIFALLV
jgi:YggT family protein